MRMSAMLKSLRFIPLCVLILSGYALADGYDNASSDSNLSKRSTVDVSSYARLIHDLVKNQMSDSLDFYKGKSCSVKIDLSSDGTIIYAVENAGDSGLCSAVVLAFHSIKRFPPPPSEQIYQKIRHATLDFKF
ncbi:cell envelope integrity protein TolA [Salmonella enterica subsp. enterica serovar Javiana]|nr:cell envelope integrity protein TolA [Salmonella enterica subsp. enterica serovar Javiana]